MKEAGCAKPLVSTSKIATCILLAAVADSYEDLVRAWFKQVDGSPGRLVSVRSVGEDTILRIVSIMPCDRRRNGRGGCLLAPKQTERRCDSSFHTTGRVRGGGHDGLIP